MAGQRLSCRGSVADAELRDRLGAQSAVFEIRTGDLAFGRRGKLLSEKCRGFTVHLEESGALMLLAALAGRMLATGQRDAAFLGHGPHRVHEIALIHLHHKLEDVAGGAAAEAVVDLLDGMHCK